ncbi:MAG: hypothetical protein Q9213_005465 [Squamulea squamosa]
MSISASPSPNLSTTSQESSTQPTEVVRSPPVSMDCWELLDIITTLQSAQAHRREIRRARKTLEQSGYEFDRKHDALKAEKAMITLRLEALNEELKEMEERVGDHEFAVQDNFLDGRIARTRERSARKKLHKFMARRSGKHHEAVPSM